MEGQFTQIQTKALFDTRLKSRDRDVMLLLQSMSGIKGFCWPSYNHIADKLGISRKTAIEAIKKLEKLNYIVKVERTIDGTLEQTTNKYFVNNNPDAGEVQKQNKNTPEVVKSDTPQNNSEVVQNLHHPLVQNLHPEKEKFFEKNARVCARTRESENDTTSEVETESGLMPEAKPDNSSNVNCANCPVNDEDIRLCANVNAEWKKAFNKSLWNFGDFVKTPERQGFFFRPTVKYIYDFQFDALKEIFSSFSKENLYLLGTNSHFLNEERIDYYDA